MRTFHQGIYLKCPKPWNVSVCSAKILILGILTSILITAIISHTVRGGKAALTDSSSQTKPTHYNFTGSRQLENCLQGLFFIRSEAHYKFDSTLHLSSGEGKGQDN